MSDIYTPKICETFMVKLMKESKTNNKSKALRDFFDNKIHVKLTYDEIPRMEYMKVMKLTCGWSSSKCCKDKGSTDDPLECVNSSIEETTNVTDVMKSLIELVMGDAVTTIIHDKTGGVVITLTKENDC